MADLEKLIAACRLLDQAIASESGLFSGDWRSRYLPQWQMPTSFEHTPRERELAEPANAAKWLFLRNFLDRRSKSSDLRIYAGRTWESEHRWLFFPEDVVQSDAEHIRNAIKHNFHYDLDIRPGTHIGQGHLTNCQILLADYEGDPRKIFSDVTCAESRERIDAFEGFGPGLQRLFSIEMYDRKLAAVSDPESLAPKVDRHLAKLLFALGAYERVQESVHYSKVCQGAPDFYLDAMHKSGVDPLTIGSAFWIIGSEGCRIQDKRHCQTIACPLYSNCEGLPYLDNVNGRLTLLTSNGKKMDTRGKGQEILNFE